MWIYLCYYKFDVYFLSHYGYVWFSENLRENVRERKWGEKVKEKKKWRKIKNKFKVNKLFLYTSLNSFYLFSSII